MEVTKVRYWTRQEYNALLKKRVHSLRLAKKEYFTKDNFWRKYEKIRGSMKKSEEVYLVGVKHRVYLIGILLM